MRRLDIGVASYGAPDKLRRTLESIRQQSRTDWRCFVIDNPGPDPATRQVIVEFYQQDPRFEPIFEDENRGYAGAVNRLFELAQTEYIAYCDNDIQIQTPGWDERLCKVLDAYHEVGMVFPGEGIFPIQRPGYTESMWGIGFCWAVSRAVVDKIGGMDQDLGHQDEADFALRLRMAGWRCAALPDVQVHHDATDSTSPESQARIAAGVRRFVDKWVKYFCGERYDYHSPNVLRWEDWPPNALYLEEYYLQHVPHLNAEPEKMKIGGRRYDLLQVPRYEGFYTGRIV